LNGIPGTRVGASVRGAAGLCLSLVVAAGLAACGSSAPSAQSTQSTQPTLSPSPTAVETPGGAEATPFAWSSDSGGVGTIGSTLSDAGYTDRYEDGALDHLGEAFALIEQGLPKAVDLDEVKEGEPGAIFGDVQIYWWPDGRHETALPPGGHGERIYRILVDLGPYVRGGDAVAYVWFVSQAQADALDQQDSMATPDPYPTQYFAFQLDKETAAALLDVFWVKG
jgi:hypothetical protein